MVTKSLCLEVVIKNPLEKKTLGYIRLGYFASFGLFFCFLLSGCERPKPTVSAEQRMAAFLFSRSEIGEVTLFREQNYMHGLNFLHFHAKVDDVNRIVAWLKMNEVSGVPSALADRVAAASANTTWRFDWTKAKVYLTYYCHPSDGTEVSIDMLLVHNGAAVLVTEGFLPPGAVVTQNPTSCRPPDRASSSNRP